MSANPTWRVRVVVVNYNGGEMVSRCIEHLLATDWPRSLLEIVVIDNASTDGSPEALAARFPDVEVYRSPANLGLAGGANLGMRDLDQVDAVALINNDAFVEPGWLRPLVEAMAGDPRVGACNAKVLFEPAFVEVTVGSEAFSPGAHDQRELGVRVSGVEVDGHDVFPKAHFRTGFHRREHGEGEEAAFHWSTGDGLLWLPVPVDADLPVKVRLRLAAEREKKVEIASGTRRTTGVVGTDPAWVELSVDGPTFDVLNNVGSVMVGGGYGADRGYWERDEGQYDEIADVVAWCGAAVLLSARYLEEVGLFAEYFMYYEDFDLSWRGRSRGWRYRYVPASRVRHRHAATAVEGSVLFDHYVHRNRLLTLVKNAPLGMVTRELFAYSGDALRLVYGEVLAPVLRRRRPQPRHSTRRLRSGLGFVRRLPSALRERREITAARTVPADALVVDRIPPEEWLSQPGHG